MALALLAPAQPAAADVAGPQLVVEQDLEPLHEAEPGDGPFTLRMRIVNEGDAPAYGATASLVLPAGLGHLSDLAVEGGEEVTYSYDPVTRTFALRAGRIDPGTSRPVVVKATSELRPSRELPDGAPLELTAVASVGSYTDAPPSACALGLACETRVDTVPAFATLGVWFPKLETEVWSEDDAPAAAGSPVSWRVDLTNASRDAGLRAVHVTTVLPPGWRYAGDAELSTYSDPYVPAPDPDTSIDEQTDVQRLTWTSLASLPRGATKHLRFAATPGSSAPLGTQTTTVRVRGEDGTGALGNRDRDYDAPDATGTIELEDSTPPDAPTILRLDPPSPAPTLAPRAFGVAEPGSTVWIYHDADCAGPGWGVGSADEFASTGIEVTGLAPGTTTIYATATDEAGNVSACSDGVDYLSTYDPDQPSPPLIDSVSPASPSRELRPRVLGSAAAGTSVTLYGTDDCSGDPLGSGSAEQLAANGIQILVPADSTTNVHATATTPSGLTSACGGGDVSYVNDRTPPTTPTSLSLDPASPSRDLLVTVRGTTDDEATVFVYPNATCSGSPVDGRAGIILRTGGLLVTVEADTATQISLDARDEAGNWSGCSDPLTYVNDRVAPPAPSDLATDPPSPGASTTPHVTGTAEAGSTVRLYTSSRCVGTEVATGTAASFAAPGLAVTATPDGTTTWYVTATDAAGNRSACSPGIGYLNDRTPPLGPTGVVVRTTPPASASKPRITGVAEDESTVRLYRDGGCAEPPLAVGTAAEMADPGLEIEVPEGATVVLHAIVSDAAGNRSACLATGATYTHPRPDPQPQDPGEPDPGPRPDPGAGPVPQPPAGPAPLPSQAPSPARAPAAPSVSALSTTATCLGRAPRAKRSLAVRYRVSRAARVTFTVQRRVRPAVRAPRRCPGATAPDTGTRRRAPAVYAPVRLAARGDARSGATRRPLVVSTSASAGRHTFAVLRASEASRLPAGRYRVLVRADTDGVASRPRIAYFWVLRGR